LPEITPAVTLQRRVNQSPTGHIYSPVGAVSISIAALANEHGPPVLDQYLLSMSDADRKPEQESSNQSEVYESFFPNSHFALDHSSIDAFDHNYNITSHCVKVSEINQRRKYAFSALEILAAGQPLRIEFSPTRLMTPHWRAAKQLRGNSFASL
jgi:hypothetical protein